MQRPGTMPIALQNHRRNLPYYLQPDYKIHEFNKRLQQGATKLEKGWWDDLMSEFFEDSAMLTIHFKEKNHLRKYTIHRRLIARFFRSLFENGVAKVFFMVAESKEAFANSSVTLECKQSSMIVTYSKPNNTKVQVDGNLSVEFSFDELMRIRSWKFVAKETTELVSKSAVISCATEKAKLEELTKKVTEFGFTSAALQHLRIGVILEPMQKLMTRQKSFGMSPREALKSVVFEKWQAHLLNQEYEQRNRLWSNGGRDPSRTAAGNKRRKPRKTPSTSSDSKTSKAKKSSALPPLPPSEVMMVDEPILMGGKFGDEDERVITRLENPQFVVSNNDGGIDENFSPAQHRPTEEKLSQ